jgi:hypothetical protein
VPRRRRLERPARRRVPAERAQDAAEMDAGERRSRTSPVASALPIAASSVAAPASWSPAWHCARPRLDTW